MANKRVCFALFFFLSVFFFSFLFACILYLVSSILLAVHQYKSEGKVCCSAAYSILDSSVRALKFTLSGDKLVAGFESGQVMVPKLVLQMQIQSKIETFIHPGGSFQYYFTFSFIRHGLCVWIKVTTHFFGC